MKAASRFSLLLLATLSLGLTSCDEVTSTLKQHKELSARMAVLLAEHRDLEAKLNDVRATLPAHVIYLQSATAVAEKARKDMEYLQSQMDAAIEGHDTTEKDLEKIEKELEQLRKL